jgi:hypothetical protein
VEFPHAQNILAACFVTDRALPAAGPCGRPGRKSKESRRTEHPKSAGDKALPPESNLAPSFERDQDSGRTSEVEIWWASPDQWRREIRSPDFHRIEIINAGKDWQKNKGDYFPDWLRETAVELINPVPPLNEVLGHVKDAEVKRLSGRTKTGQLIPGKYRLDHDDRNC